MKKTWTAMMAAVLLLGCAPGVQAAELETGSRYTDAGADIIIQEGADGLWDEGVTFRLQMENGYIPFEKGSTLWVDEESGMEIRWECEDGILTFTVEETGDQAAQIRVSDLELFLSRNLPAGTYRLEVETSISENFYQTPLFGGEVLENVADEKKQGVDDFITLTIGTESPRLYTTEVRVPVGEQYILSGEKKQEIDTAAYVSDESYVMLPVRAVAVAIGLDNDRVMWDADSRTVTILYNQRIISMTEGEKFMSINGTKLATTSAVTIRDDRTFLGLRDLATALGVTDLSWDADTQTAYFNITREA